MINMIMIARAQERERYVERVVRNDEDKRDLLLRATGNSYDKSDERKDGF